MIKTAILAKYRINEFIQFISNILMIVKQHGPDKLKVRALYAALLQNYESLQAVYKQDPNNEITLQLSRLDDRRDRAIICLRKLCDGYTYHHNEKLSAAGKKILACIDKYGSKLYHLNYSAETAVLKNLARDLQTHPECISAVQAMQLEEVVNEIHTANVKFEKLFIQRLGEYSQEEAKTTKEHIQFTTGAYRTLVQHVDAHATLAPSEEHTSLINHMNENIEHFNQMVERRKRGGETEEVDIIADESLDAPR